MLSRTLFAPQIVIFNLYAAGENQSHGLYGISGTVDHIAFGEFLFFRSQTIQHRLYFIYGRIAE